jgi:hypothetical protein
METGATPVLRRCGRRTLKFHCIDTAKLGLLIEIKLIRFTTKSRVVDWKITKGQNQQVRML